MNGILGLLAGVGAATLIACAGARSTQPSAPSPATAVEPGASPLGPDDASLRAEIDELDRQIAADRATLGLPPAAPAACAALPSGCAGTRPTAMSVAPAQDDPTCTPGPGDTCQDACTLADSICSNAARICDLATQLGGTDAYANETCERGQASCTASRERCCGCV